MKLRLTVDEAKQAIADYVAKRVGGFVTKENVTLLEHTEGEYEDAHQIFDGFEVDVENVFPKKE